ncbi:MAG: amidohydrolase family protein, partial [Bacteroidales bacterium]|nr:amidohydrolase family protein [Bacteroidales bacterium]
NMLVDDQSTISKIFAIKTRPILIHSEDEAIIKANLEAARAKYGDDIPITEHPEIRNRKACIMSSIRALEKAMECGTHLHLLHVTTAEEVHMIRAAKIQKAAITGETSANYLTFCDEDYPALGAKIKCNPAIKTANDRKLLRDALHDGIIDTIGSDHAPHLLEEKDRPYTSCPSGVPSIQHSLSAVITVALEEKTPLERVASAMSERTADIFGLKDRGYLKEGYVADMVVFDPEKEFTVGKPAYKCGWTPYEGRTLKGWVKDVYLSGKKVVADGDLVEEKPSGSPLVLHTL